MRRMMRTLLLVGVAVACGFCQLANSTLVGHSQSSYSGTGVAAKILRRKRRGDTRPAPYNNTCDVWWCTESCDFGGFQSCKFASLKPTYNVFTNIFQAGSSAGGVR